MGLGIGGGIVASEAVCVFPIVTSYFRVKYQYVIHIYIYRSKLCEIDCKNVKSLSHGERSATKPPSHSQVNLNSVPGQIRAGYNTYIETFHF